MELNFPFDQSWDESYALFPIPCNKYYNSRSIFVLKLDTKLGVVLNFPLSCGWFQLVM